jgi:hypothetical protein
MPTPDPDNDRYAWYSLAEIAELLTKARALGFDLDSDELNGLTIQQLDTLVNSRQ